MTSFSSNFKSPNRCTCGLIYYMLAISLLIRPLLVFLISDEDLQTKSVLFPSLPQPAKSQRGGSALLPKQRSLILILSPSRIKLIWTTIWPIHDAPNMENGLLLGWVRGRLRAGQESMTTKPADRVTNSFARVTHLMDPGLNYSSSSTHIYISITSTNLSFTIYWHIISSAPHKTILFGFYCKAI